MTSIDHVMTWPQDYPGLWWFCPSLSTASRIIKRVPGQDYGGRHLQGCLATKQRVKYIRPGFRSRVYLALRHHPDLHNRAQMSLGLRMSSAMTNQVNMLHQALGQARGQSHEDIIFKLKKEYKSQNTRQQVEKRASRLASEPQCDAGGCGDIAYHKTRVHEPTVL